MSFTDEVMKEFEEEDKLEQQQPTETPSDPEPQPEPEHNEDEPKPAEEQPEEHPEDSPKDEPPKEWSKPGQPITAKPREIPDDKFSRAEFSFKRQLGKTKEKYENELKERDEKYAKLEAELAELKKGLNKDKPKTRMDFEDDEEFLDYKTKQGVKAAMAEFEEAAAKKEAERIENERKEREEREALEEKQRAWLDNVNQAFGGDKDRSDKFLNRLQYCTEKGFGTILDNCPVAADYLINNPYGPVVFEKIVNDRDTFSRVFDERRMSPLDIYYELRSVEKELRAAPAESPAPAAPAPKPMPHLGRPGKQAGSNTQPDIWNDDDAMRDYIRGNV